MIKIEKELYEKLSNLDKENILEKYYFDFTLKKDCLHLIFKQSSCKEYIAIFYSKSDILEEFKIFNPYETIYSSYNKIDYMSLLGFLYSNLDKILEILREYF